MSPPPSPTHFARSREKIRAEYTLGFYPEEGADTPDDRPGWHPLSVEVPDEPGVRVGHRAAYYVPPRRTNTRSSGAFRRADVRRPFLRDVSIRSCSRLFGES